MCLSVCKQHCLAIPIGTNYIYILGCDIWSLGIYYIVPLFVVQLLSLES